MHYHKQENQAHEVQSDAGAFSIVAVRGKSQKFC
jgi:hypothetical protein